jgi:hypothetical protein
MLLGISTFRKLHFDVLAINNCLTYLIPLKCNTPVDFKPDSLHFLEQPKSSTMSTVSGDDCVTADNSAKDFSCAQTPHILNDGITVTSGDSAAGGNSIDSQDNDTNRITSSHQANIRGEEPHQMHTSQFQPVLEADNDSRREAKRERSISDDCETGTEKRMRCSADDEPFSVANLAIQRVDEGPARDSVIDLTSKPQATAS